MAEINLNPYTAESDAIARRLRMAEALNQQAMQPMELPTQAGVRVSPYAGLAKMLQGYTSGLMQNQALGQQEALSKRYAADTGADFQSLAKLLSAPGQAAVPAGAPTFTPNVGAGELADNARMTMQPERNEMGEIIQPGQPGAGNFGVTPGAPAQAAIAAGRLTPEGFSAMKTPMGQQQYMSQLLAQIAPKAPIKLGKDESLLDPRSYAVLAKGPVDPEKGLAPLNQKDYTPESWKAATSGGKMDRTQLIPFTEGPAGLAVYNLYVKQEKAANRIPKSIEQFETAQRIAGRAPAAINYGSPVAATDAEGRPVFIQAGRAGGAPAVIEGFSPPAPKLKDVPPSINTAMTQNQIMLNKLGRIDDLLIKTPGATGVVKGITPSIILNRLDKEGTALRAALTELAATKVHDLSGAAVTASEFGRLKPFLPQPTDDADTIKTKLEGMKTEIQEIMDTTNSIYSADQGYKPIPNLAPKPPETPPISALKEGQTTTFKNGQSWTLQQGKPVQVK